jgi:tRNA pseudouridine13 synthase
MGPMTEQDLPYLTETVPGIGGRMRSMPEDFIVEEHPLYLPCGEGEHLYLKITKRALSTPDLVTRLSSTWGIKAHRIGVAGLKDTRAITTQMVSVQGITPDALEKLRPDDRLLSVEILGRHRNRLRTGHHAGNSFRIILRGVNRHAAESVPLIVAQLTQRGMPNYFGPQRQGREGQNYLVGAELLLDARRRHRLSRAKRMWFLHAYQSYIFNRILVRRIQTIDQVLEGDWAIKHVNGACFPVEDAAVEQKRVETFEISPTGILFGSRASWASGKPGEIEQTICTEIGATPESLTQAAKSCGFRGERRALREKVNDLAWDLKDDTLTLAFRLVPGTYATSLLREFMKPDRQALSAGV